MKIFIAVPTYENIMPDTFKSIYGLDKCGHWCVFDFVRGYSVEMARNLIAKQAKAEKADYVFMVDNDIRLPEDALKNLLENPVDVCLGFYLHRWHEGANNKTCLCRLGEFNYTDMYTVEQLRELREKGVTREQIHGGGLGCALIKTSVFEKIAYPWFKWTNYSDGGVLSEDLYFAEQCHKNNIPIYADPRVACAHLFRRFEGAL